MADVSRDTFDDGKNYKEVTIQQGQELADNELNELQKILRVEQHETSAAALVRGRATKTDTSTTDIGPFKRPKFGYSEGQEWAPSVTAGVLSVKAGALYVDGVRLLLDADLNLATESSITFGAVGADTYGFVVATIVYEEVDAVADPNIATPQLGETTRRIRTKITFSKHESFVSWQTAWEALSVLAGTKLDDGYPARIVLYRYLRTTANATLVQSEVMSLVKHVPACRFLQQQTFMKTFREKSGSGSDPDFDVSEGNDGGGDDPDGVLIWLSDESKLVIGDTRGHSPLPWTRAAHGGFMLRSATGPDHNAMHPIGNSGYSLLESIEIPSGHMLAFFSATIRHGAVAKGNGSIAPREMAVSLPSTMTSSYSGAQKVRIQELTVAAPAEIEKDPDALIIAVRRGRDLIFRNGDVVRGRRGAINGSFFDLGSNPSEWRAVCARDADECHTSSEGGVARVLDFTSLSNGAGPTHASVESRDVSVLIKTGEYTIEGDRIYGNNLSAAVKYHLRGASRNLAVLYVTPSDNVTPRVSGDVVRFVANTVIIEGLYIEQTGTVNGTNDLGWTLALEGYDVILRDCTIVGPVRISARNCLVENCRFSTPGSDNEDGIYPTGATVTKAGCLSITDTATAPSQGGRHVVRRCSFVVDKLRQIPAAVRIIPSTYSKFLLEDCEFDHGEGFTPADQDDSAMASIDIAGHLGSVEIVKCRFLGHRGKDKPGEAGGGAWPFTATYDGVPIIQSDSSNSFGLAAAAYISALQGRTTTSRTVIRGCYFDLRKVAQRSSGSVSYTCFAAAMFTRRQTYSGVNIYANIAFEDNDLDMFQLSGNGWDPSGNGPWVSGFWLAPQWAGPPTSFDVRNIRVRGNRFELGSATGGYHWRSILSGSSAAWPGAGPSNYLLETSGCIYIALKNGTDAAAVSNTNRTAYGVDISGNRLGASQLVTSGNADLDDSNYPWPTFVGIALCTGDFAYLNGAPTVSASDPTGAFGAIGGCIADNEVNVPDVTSTLSAIPVVAIYETAARCRVSENCVRFGHTGGATTAIWARGNNNLVVSNLVIADLPIVATDVSVHITNNNAKGSSVAISGGTRTFTGGGTGDNIE